MEPDEYVEGLSGVEIINDILDKIEQKLRGDCNLRESDAYTGGYDGWIEVHLNLHGLDTEVVKTRIVMGPAHPDQDPDQKVVETRIEIPLEERLNAVRERSGQDIPTLAKDEEGKTVVKKRHYAKTSVAGE